MATTKRKSSDATTPKPTAKAAAKAVTPVGKPTSKPAEKTAPAKAPAAPKAAPTKKAAKPAVVAEAAPAAKPVPAKPKGAKNGAARPGKNGVGDSQRRNYIEVAAYYIAERRGFAPGDPFDDWLQAEHEIDRLIAEGMLGNA